VPALALGAVDAGDHLQVREVGAHPDRRPERAEGVEPLGAGETAVLLLEVAGGDVVGAGDAEDGVARLRRRGPGQAVAQHHGDLPLVLHLPALRRQHDRHVGADQRRGGLEEEERLLGHGVAELFGMLGVVAADRHDLARAHRQQERGGRAVDVAAEVPAAGEGLERIGVEDAEPVRILRIGGGPEAFGGDAVEEHGGDSTHTPPALR
jgi:hypothetical protein